MEVVGNGGSFNGALALLDLLHRFLGGQLLLTRHIVVITHLDLEDNIFLFDLLLVDFPARVLEALDLSELFFVLHFAVCSPHHQERLLVSRHSLRLLKRLRFYLRYCVVRWLL